MQIVIGCDNAAVSLKNILVKFLETKGVEVEDVGCYTSEDPINYPLVAKKVCDKVIESGYTKRGMLICGTGIGMAMTANKFKGIRAAVCHDIFSTQRSILSNNGNVLCMGERVIGVYRGGAAAPSGKALIIYRKSRFDAPAPSVMEPPK